MKKVYKAVLECEDIRYGTVLLTAVFTGLRRGELCGLKWENIDLENQLIAVDRSVSRVRNHGIVEKEPKTPKSKRSVEIPRILAEQLKRYKAWYYERKAEAGDRWDNEDWTFINLDTGKRVDPGTILTWVNKITEEEGLGHWTVHSYRHTNITMKLLNNVPLLEVSGEAGHSRTSTTTDRYGHFLATHRRMGPTVFDNLIPNTTEPNGKDF